MRTPFAFVWRIAAAALLASCGGSDLVETPELQVVATAVPLVDAPRLAIAADTTIWIVWSEGTAGLASVASARVDRFGAVTRQQVSPSSADAKAVARIAMAGAVPVVAWREVGMAGDFVRVAAWDGTRWADEPGRGPFVAGDIDLLAAGGGRVYLRWSELPPGSTFRQFVAIRSSAGLWSAPIAVPAPTDPAFVVDSLDAAAGDDGSLMAVWAESPPPPTSAPTTRTLWAARFDPGLGAWQAAAPLDTGLALGARVVAGSGGRWLAFLTAGDPAGARELRAIRFDAGAWQGPPRRVDAAPGESVREAAAGWDGAAEPWLAWVASTADVPPRFAVRAVRLDAATGGWTAPTTLVGPTDSLAAGLQVHRSVDGRFAAGWGTATGPSGPFVAIARGDTWQAATRVETDATFGNGLDMKPLAGGGFAVVWFRTPSALQDIVLRRFR